MIFTDLSHIVALVFPHDTGMLLSLTALDPLVQVMNKVYAIVYADFSLLNFDDCIILSVDVLQLPPLA